MPNVNQIGNSAMDLPFQVSPGGFSLDLVMNSVLGWCWCRSQHPGLKTSGGVGMFRVFFMLVVVDFSSPVSGCEALGSGIL